jgi:hypothetical protein
MYSEFPLAPSVSHKNKKQVLHGYRIHAALVYHFYSIFSFAATARALCMIFGNRLETVQRVRSTPLAA